MLGNNGETSLINSVISKGRRALLWVPSTVGKSVCLCWAPSEPRGPKFSNLPSPFYMKGVSLGYVCRAQLKSKRPKGYHPVLHIRGRLGVIEGDA